MLFLAYLPMALCKPQKSSAEKDHENDREMKSTKDTYPQTDVKNELLHLSFISKDY